LGVTRDDLQFIEVFNPTSELVDLTGWRIRGGIQYDFPAGTVLGANPLILVSFDPTSAANTDLLDGFALHHGIGTNHVKGGYSGRLSSAGELVELQRPDRPPLDEPDFIPYLIEDSVLYDTVIPWPVGDPIAGIDRIAPVFHGSAETSWRASMGTPGSIDFTDAVTGDLTGDGGVNDSDIDALYDAIARGSNVEYFDLNGSSAVDQADVTFLVQSILQAFMGDANLDGQVNAVDLNQVGLNWQATHCVGWATGDFTGDGKVNAADLNLLGINWRNVVALAADDATGPRLPRAPLAVALERPVAAIDAVFARESATQSFSELAREPLPTSPHAFDIRGIDELSIVQKGLLRDRQLKQRSAQESRLRYRSAEANADDQRFEDEIDQVFAGAEINGVLVVGLRGRIS
jgi:hypothetical protein